MGPMALSLHPQVSTLLLTPICPHTCHHIWSDVLRRPGSVLKAGWPHAALPDAGIQRQAAYLEALISNLRKAIARAELPQKARKGQPATPGIKVRWLAASKHTSFQATERSLQSG